MAVSGLLGNIFKVIHFTIKLVIKLTFNLVLELLKFGALTLILLGVICGSVVAFLYTIQWTYVTSDGNIFYTLCVATGLIIAAITLFVAMHYVAKNVLKLTNLTLSEFILLWLKPVKCKKGSNGTKDSKSD